MGTRKPRQPIEQSEFDRLPMATHTVAARRWVNLRFAKWANEKTLFYANPESRLTPVRMDVPCLYLAQTEASAFQELYGDKLYLAKEAKAQLLITEEECKERVFVTVQTKEVVLCDLVDEGAAQKIGLDSGTLYDEQLSFPQSFAERIYHHPARVDGIRYLSRHTNERCVVLWERTPNSGLAKLVAGVDTRLCDRAVARGLDAIELFGDILGLIK